ncbi:MAG: cellulose 1,4-beta-cellobiosidase [Streptomyces sp.]|nr:cellulose 1,4-beta-cellobiosidase [Streptomyces sp.]
MNPARRTTITSAAVLAVTGGLLTTATAPASAATTCASPVFKRQFFANTTFSGTPKKTDCDTTIDQTWTGAPTSGLPSNNFGVRWSVTRDFGSGGPFSLAASGLDGIRVYVDGVRKVDLWKNTSTTVSKTVNVTIPSGKHTLRVDYVNWTGSAKVKFTYTPRTSATVDKVKPLVPTGTSVAYDSASGKAKLSWAKSKEMDLAGYKVYRRLKGTAFGGSPLATTTATSYTDIPPATGATYYYEIRAYDKAGNESTGTADQLVTTADRTAPAAPTGLYAKVGPGAVTLAWDTDGVTDTYRVYRATAPQGPFTRIADGLDSAWYRDSGADLTGRLYYRVTAVDPVGNESAPSAVADTGEPDTTPPAQVTDVTVEGTTAGNAVRWPASSDDRHVNHYEVWAAPEGASDPDGPETVFGLSFNDQQAEAGVPLTYRVQAVDDYGNLAPVSAPVTATRPAPGAVAAPTGVEGTPLDSATELTWASVTDATGYRVYRRTDRNAAWTRLGDRPTTALRYSDSEAPGVSAYYYVAALDAEGHESAPSESVQVWRETPATPTAPVAPTITLSAPYKECTTNDCAPHGGTGVPLTVTLRHDRLLSGYTYRFYGTSDTGYVTTQDATVTWTPPGPGLYSFEVRAIDYYGRSGPFTSVRFMVG